MPDIFIAAGVRTPFSRIDGALAAFDAIELSVPVVQAISARISSGAPPDFVDWGSVVPNLGWSNIMTGMDNHLEGGCLCGAVRYVLRAPPDYVYFCHCRDCQRESGSPFVTDMSIDKTTLQIEGLLTRYSRKGDSGKSVHRNFCAVCGTTLLTEFDVDSQHVAIKACSLDDPSWLNPDRHLYVSRMQPWLELSDRRMRYERDC